jgi:Domain of unknown function (DUF305)
VKSIQLTIIGALVIAAGLTGAALTTNAQQPSGSAAAQYPDEAPFLAENSAAMDKMMAGMDVKPTGDVDADFVAMMIPHHQGAIDMAVAELRYGKNEQLRRIAQEIIVDQQQEIAAMNLALGKPLPPSSAAPTQVPADSTPAASSDAPGDNAAMPHHGMTMSPMNHMNMK